ncbi:MAG: ribosomal protein S18-alanine N-acetyltransferase [Ruminococcus sp.]|nr:ribosomal protein S18-alanine N-acetyltransferase [uncultured Ruminococcus sp.]MBQ2470638.1 ribosomal protein S18-alanine N-acetyltransferase [Ruminococcus sp.]MBQ4170535.1 ribosomal protein S18-alanine N-acetyltransferase [Ruminococcus sp.]MBQ4262592.1 ribosomal protein S18-alanine N-acetyltransferase [Ruminococcus sp.]
MRIEKMTAAHLDEVAAIENDCFSHPWSRRSLESELQNETSRFLVAVEDGKVIGYIGMSAVIDEGYLFNAAVDSHYRKKGVGSALVRELVTWCQKHDFAFLTLEVRESNAPAIALYSRFGFVRVGERKNYYSDPAENALLMTKYF